MANKRYMQAINEALNEEMERDSKVIIFGEDVELAIMGDCRGLTERFGRDRVRNTPICEQSLTGMAVGAAAAGHRVVLHLMFSNFIYTGMDAIGNQMAKMRLMSGGQAILPITVIASYGGGGSNAAQHSDSAYPVLMNLGGINVLMPSSPYDAKGLLKTAIRGNNPSFFMEAGGRGGEKGEVHEGEVLVPLGKANVLKNGNDLTLLAIGSMVKPAMQAAKTLTTFGIDVEVIDPRTLVPFDEATVLASVKKTGHLVICDEARECCGAASQIAAVVAEHGFFYLRAPIKRLTTPNVCLPYAPNAEAFLIPNADAIVRTCRGLLTHVTA